MSVAEIKKNKIKSDSMDRAAFRFKYAYGFGWAKKCKIR